jgi:hypothetical protein
LLLVNARGCISTMIPWHVRDFFSAPQ